MPAYDIDDLRALVLKRLRVSDTTRYSSTGATDNYDWIDDALARGQEEFVRQTRCVLSPVIIQPKASYRTYRMPDLFLDIVSAYYYSTNYTDGYKEMTVTTVEELNNTFSDWRTDTGTPTHIYIDRLHGNHPIIGLYPIPTTDGGTVSPDATYQSEVTFVCANYTYNQDYIIASKRDEIVYFLNTSLVIGQPEAMSNCIWIDMHRLPQPLKKSDNTTDSGVSYPEIPQEYHRSLVDYAAYDLLENNPEDSAEFKRSMMCKGIFDKEVKSYLDKRKRPQSAQDVRGRSAAWGWLNSMNHYTEQF